MTTQRINSRALIRHFSGRTCDKISRIAEISYGVIRFLIWTPRIIHKFAIQPKFGIARPLEVESSNEQEVLTAWYINLDSRKDRRSQIETELEKLTFVNPSRLAATRDENGSLGCARSHINALGRFLNSSSEIAMICEDDVRFTASSIVIYSLVREFRTNPALDVLCLSYRLRGPRLPISKMLAVGNNIQTTACYVLRRKAAEALRENFLLSEALLSAGVSPGKASIDITWKTLQFHALTFAVPRDPIAHQRLSYSDITRTVKFYRP